MFGVPSMPTFLYMNHLGKMYSSFVDQVIEQHLIIYNAISDSISTSLSRISSRYFNFICFFFYNNLYKNEVIYIEGSIYLRINVTVQVLSTINIR